MEVNAVKRPLALKQAASRILVSLKKGRAQPFGESSHELEFEGNMIVHLSRHIRHGKPCVRIASSSVPESILHEQPFVRRVCRFVRMHGTLTYKKRIRIIAGKIAKHARFFLTARSQHTPFPNEVHLDQSRKQLMIGLPSKQARQPRIHRGTRSRKLQILLVDQRHSPFRTSLPLAFASGFDAMQHTSKGHHPAGGRTKITLARSMLHQEFCEASCNAP